MTNLVDLELNLRNNNIGDVSGIRIEENISNLDKLTSLVLDFGKNNIIGEWIGN